MCAAASCQQRTVCPCLHPEAHVHVPHRSASTCGADAPADPLCACACACVSTLQATTTRVSCGLPIISCALCLRQGGELSAVLKLVSPSATDRHAWESAWWCISRVWGVGVGSCQQKERLWQTHVQARKCQSTRARTTRKGLRRSHMPNTHCCTHNVPGLHQLRLRRSSW